MAEETLYPEKLTRELLTHRSLYLQQQRSHSEATFNLP
jgi:hypothetical protein